MRQSLLIMLVILIGVAFSLASSQVKSSRDSYIENIMKLSGKVSDPEIVRLAALPSSPILRDGKWVDTVWLWISEDRGLFVEVSVENGVLKTVDTVINFRAGK